MPRGTTPEPVHKGQVMPNWARIALRMNSLLLGSLSRNSASSSSTLNAPICDFCDFVSFRAMTTPGHALLGLWSWYFPPVADASGTARGERAPFLLHAEFDARDRVLLRVDPKPQLPGRLGVAEPLLGPTVLVEPHFLDVPVLVGEVDGRLVGDLVGLLLVPVLDGDLLLVLVVPDEDHLTGHQQAGGDEQTKHGREHLSHAKPSQNARGPAEGSAGPVGEPQGG